MHELAITGGAIVLVDDIGLGIMSGHSWHIDSKGYVRRTTQVKNRFVSFWLHRLIAGAGKDEVVDHIDGNLLNNTSENLRVCSTATNAYNRRKRMPNTSSVFKGVTLAAGKWQAQIAHQRKRYYLGTFADEHEAAHAYNKAAIKYFGEFACLNPIGVDK